ncbi:sigma-54 interaction domain-containing protein [Coprobacter tertius]|uniref:Sigma-54 dependent transcriptional regulator n=1 Tax=Coprobacter tertius TaxID=2944915 RepID=A0ABT1MH71_9BACT|nr:sigma-54 dependent transcriptional regulator [Coprobacter tertius]MCP9611983.1 sigma-54 dependent transcriptional regulator [Coprobacter tertius]
MTTSDIQQAKQRFGIIGNTPGLNRAISRALQIAPTDLSVLITGESGTGKEFFPQIIHTNSRRKHGRYIAVNCGAIPEGTIDSELFGHEKGSFTGALSDRKGYFEEADGGTIFLDEVGELPLTTQARLLRVLETGEFIKVGSSKVLKTNVRIVAATNLDMVKAISEGKFREDLFYRLNTVPIELPPLRNRVEDILLLFRKFSNDFAEKYRMPAIQLTDDAREMLTSYRWPGNIRQLKNVTEQISIFETSREVSAAVLRPYLPAYNIERLPVLSANHDNKDGFQFGNEREMLYQVIFEMKKEVNELKHVVHNLMAEQHSAVNEELDVYAQEPVIKHNNSPIHPVLKTYHLDENASEGEIIHTENEYEEEPYTMEDVERETIRKALERNNGKRKKTAEELKISERTLYRKIKEYNLE